MLTRARHSTSERETRQKEATNSNDLGLYPRDKRWRWRWRWRQESWELRADGALTMNVFQCSSAAVLTAS